VGDEGNGTRVAFTLVTGAGASHNFGVNGNSIPLMNEWSDRLIEKLSARNNSYPDALRLTKQLSGTEFEERIGTFLRIVDRFPMMEQILEPSLHFQASPGIALGGTFATWFTTTKFHLDTINGLLKESLNELFGVDQFNLEAAAEAYAQLFQQFHVDRQYSVAMATTNYDISGEVALERFGFTVDSGERPSVLGTGNSKLAIDKIVGGLPERTPFLHLHGKIGWFESGGETYALPSNVRQAGADAIPIVMLPDLEKSYESNLVINSIWEQFTTLISKSDRVLVLGHSLHDEYLVRVLRQHLSKPERLAISVHCSDNFSESEVLAMVNEEKRIESLFPQATVFRIDFAKDRFSLDDVYNSWVKKMAS